MKHLQIFLLFFYIFCSLIANGQVKYEYKDKEILKDIFNQLKNMKDKNTAELVVAAGKYFIKAPYAAHTLETEPEQLVINLRGFDCTTYAENCLAIARTVKSGNLTFDTFSVELAKVRYRNNQINGYPSRLHYFSDWIYENDKKGIIRHVSGEISCILFPLELDFMSTHPDSYKQLKTNRHFSSLIAKKETEINDRTMCFIPKNKVTEIEHKLKEGDIIGISTSIKGLDISHVGILVKKNGRIHLLHASSKVEKVIVSENTLEDYLNKQKSATGILVVRPT